MVKKAPKSSKRYGLTAFKENIFLIKTGDIMLQVHDQEKPEIQQEKSIKSHCTYSRSFSRTFIGQKREGWTYA